MDKIFGPWDKSFDNLYRFKAQIEKKSPGSFVVIDNHTVNGKIRFNRCFFALRACVDGFLAGCRPYLAVDSTFLNGRYRGQLCVAIAVDGHNWMYPVAVGVIDSESNENWIWFMQRLREAIGCPAGMTFSTDCGLAVMNGVSEVFPDAEHRECMWHLVQNFKKRYSGKVFDEHLWQAAYSWNTYMFEKHYLAMAAENPESMKYLMESHTKLWTRSQFNRIS
jgi:transposase-like protein